MTGASILVRPLLSRSFTGLLSIANTEKCSYQYCVKKSYRRCVIIYHILKESVTDELCSVENLFNSNKRDFEKTKSMLALIRCACAEESVGE